MTEFKAGDKVYVDGIAADMDWFDSGIVREVYFDDIQNKLCVYDDWQLNYQLNDGEYTIGWFIDGSVIKPIIRHV